MLLMRTARHDDLPDVLQLMTQDAMLDIPIDVGPPLPSYYLTAFERIDADPGELLVVAQLGDKIVGTFQMSFIPYLMWRGGQIAQIEFVRVAAHLRGRRIGERMMHWAIDEARSRGCARIQLDTNKARADAHRFYERLGFKATHEGMKLFLG
ncbi:GNAT family N-acetyltransferase [Nocardia thraciensis]